MTDEGTDEMLDNGDRQSQPGRKGLHRMDAVSAVAGLLFIAIAILALTNRFWAEVDPVLAVGGAIVAVGAAMIVGVIRRGRREREPIDG